jgi:hypothetical protein
MASTTESLPRSNPINSIISPNRSIVSSSTNGNEDNIVESNSQIPANTSSQNKKRKVMFAGEGVADITKLLDLDLTKYVEHEMYVLKTIT